MIIGIAAGQTWEPEEATTPINVVGKKVSYGLAETVHTVPMTSGLTDGSDAGASIGDFVIIAAGGTDVMPTATQLPGGLTELARLFSDDTLDANLRVWAGTLTDLNSAIFSAPTLDRKVNVTVHVLRNVGRIELFTTAMGIDSPNANPPALHSDFEGGVLYAVGHGTQQDQNIAFNDPPGFTDIAKTSGLFTGRGTALLAGLIHNAPMGDNDPAAFTGLGANSWFSWAALTMKLLPVGAEVTEIPAIAGETSYTNSGGSGARGITQFNASWNFNMASGSHTGLWNGNTGDYTQWFPGTSNTGNVMQWYFHRRRVIDQIRWYQSGGDVHGNWQLQGSNNGIDWTVVGATFGLGGPSPSTHTFANTVGYKFYRLMGVGGNKSSGPYLFEIQFKISP